MKPQALHFHHHHYEWSCCTHWNLPFSSSFFRPLWLDGNERLGATVSHLCPWPHMLTLQTHVSITNWFPQFRENPCEAARICLNPSLPRFVAAVWRRQKMGGNCRQWSLNCNRETVSPLELSCSKWVRQLSSQDMKSIWEGNGNKIKKIMITSKNSVTTLLIKWCSSCMTWLHFCSRRRSNYQTVPEC